LKYPKPGIIGGLNILSFTDFERVCLFICGEIEHLQVGQFGEPLFEHLQGGFFNQLFIQALSIQSEAEFDNFLTGFKNVRKVGERDFGVIHEELFQICHLNSGLDEYFCREPVGMTGIKSNY